MNEPIFPSIDELPTQSGVYDYRGRIWAFYMDADGLRGHSFAQEDQLYYGRGKFWRRYHDGQQWTPWVERAIACYPHADWCIGGDKGPCNCRTPAPARQQEPFERATVLKDANVSYSAGSKPLALARLANFELACKEWSDKTEWVQDEINAGTINVKALGRHRADVMTDLIRELRTEVEQFKAQLVEVKLISAVAQAYGPSIYKCAHCGYPVASGYCCTSCNSATPRGDK